MSEGLYRTEDDRLVAGVCAGIARYLGAEPRLVRLVFVALFPVSWVWYLGGVVIAPTASEIEEL